MADPAPGFAAGLRVRFYCWGWCKSCRWLRRWYVERTGLVVCPRRHYGGVTTP